MLQRLIGVAVGALVTFLLLWISDVTNQADRIPWYLVAVVIGAVTSLLWPVVIGFWLGGRARARRDEQIQKEVDRQIAEKARPD